MATIFAIAITGCKDASKSVDAAEGAAVEASPDKDSKVWLGPQNSPPSSYPPSVAGSPYRELLTAVIVDWGKDKDEFETTAEYQARIAGIPDKVSTKFGKYFAFKSNTPETEWDADTRTLKIVHRGEYKTSDKISLGLDNNGELSILYGMNVQGCPPNPKISLSVEDAKKIQGGLNARAVGVFYVGSIDFSKKGWVREATLLNHETIPGFHSTAQAGASGKPLGVWDLDFDVQRIDLVEGSSGKILASIPCRG